MSFLSQGRLAKEEQERRERELLAHPCLIDSNGIASPIYCYCPDDFTVCLSVKDMESEIEPNDVDEPYEIFDAVGKVMRAKLDNNGYVRIILDEKEPAKPGRLEEIIRGVARSWKNHELPEPLSLEDLNYYILVNKIGR